MLTRRMDGVVMSTLGKVEFFDTLGQHTAYIRVCVL
jgi:hypothetical protein